MLIKKLSKLTNRKKKAGIIEIILSIVLILFGLAGLMLPILPGWLLIIAGLALMGEKRIFRWVRDTYTRKMILGKNRTGCNISKNIQPSYLPEDEK